MVVEISESAVDVAVVLWRRRGLFRAPSQLMIQISLGTTLSHLEAGRQPIKMAPYKHGACPKTLKTYKSVRTLGESPLE